MKTAKLIMALTVLSVIACQRPSNSRYDIDKISVASLLNSSQAPPDKAESLAQAAEKLLNADGYEEAYSAAELSLKEDPNNLRGKFVYSLTEFLKSQKGILARLKPLGKKFPKITAALQVELVAEHQIMTASKAKFYQDGIGDITNEKELQLFLDNLYDALVKLKTFLNFARDKELTIVANSILFPNLLDEYVEACEITESEKWIYEIKCPEDKFRTHITINQADFEYMNDVVNYKLYQIGLMNAYSVNDSFAALEEHLSSLAPTPSGELFNRLLSNKPEFATLRATHKMKSLGKYISEIIVSVNWIMENQSTLCPKGANHPSNRMGFLVSKGICLPLVAKPFLHLDELKSNLAGQATAITINEQKNPYYTKANFLAFILNPPKDFRQLGPYRFNACNDLMGVGDQRLGGIYPLGDTDKILSLSNEECRK